jgi:hypothetical protein
MDTGVFSQAQLSHQILTFDIPDEAIRASCERRPSVHLGILHSRNSSGTPPAKPVRRGARA